MCAAAQHSSDDMRLLSRTPRSAIWYDKNCKTIWKESPRTKREHENLQRIGAHTNIVACKNHVVSSEGRSFLILESASMDLLVFLKTMRRLHDTPANYQAICMNFIEQMVLAIQHCHRTRNAHLDIKLENFLIFMYPKTQRHVVKLADFESAQEWDEGGMLVLNRRIGTPSYQPPEIVLATRPSKIHAAAIDVWALGIVCYCIWNNYLPWNAAKQGDPAFDKYTTGQKLHVYARTPKYVHSMLRIRPKDRPTIEEVFTMVQEQHAQLRASSRLSCIV